MRCRLLSYCKFPRRLGRLIRPAVSGLHGTLTNSRAMVGTAYRSQEQMPDCGIAALNLLSAVSLWAFLPTIFPRADPLGVNLV